MPRLLIKKSIERIAVALTQFARDEQWLHLNLHGRRPLANA